MASGHAGTAGQGARAAYASPELVEWGTVVDLTRGTGTTNYTDETECTNPGGVTFEGSSNATFCD